MNKIYILIIIIVLFSLFLLSSNSCKGKEEKYFENKIAMDLSNFDAAIFLYGKDYGSLPYLNKGANDYKISYEELFSILKDENNKRRGYIYKDDKMLDPWRRPYVIWFDINGDGKVLLGNGKVIDDTVAIWSMGMNGIDEYGDGDDVSSWYLGLKFGKIEKWNEEQDTTATDCKE